MAELNFSKGKRLVKVIESNIPSENGTEIFLYQKDHKCCLECSARCNSKKKCCPQCALIEYHSKDQVAKPTINMENLAILYEVLKNSKSQKDLEDIIEEVSGSAEGAGLKGGNVKKDKIVLRSGRFQLVPSNIYGQPDCLFYVGRAGSGKTFALAEWLREFKQYYPKYRIYFFSQKTEDKLIDNLITKRIPLEQLLNTEFEADDFKESCCVWDDVDVISDKKVDKATFDLINKVLEIGRSYNTFVCMTMHLPANHGQTKRILNRCTHFMYFKNSSNHGTDYALKEYFGFNNDELKKLKKIQSRSITILRDCPQIVLSNDMICFQDAL